MALTPEDRAEIKEAIAEGIREGSCACGLSPEAQSEVSHFMGMVKDLGGGDRGNGIEVMRDLLKFWSKVRLVGEKIGVAIIKSALIGLLGIIGTLIWLGFKVKVGE